jgi:N-acetylneuraminic acid mutarotase
MKFVIPLLIVLLTLIAGCFPWLNGEYEFQLGNTVKVVNTGTVGLRVRSTPAGTVTAVVPNNWVFQIGNATPESATLDGVTYLWWRVVDAQYESSPTSGWVAERYLTKVSPNNLSSSTVPAYFTASTGQINSVVAQAHHEVDAGSEWYDYSTGNYLCLFFVRDVYSGQAMGWSSAHAAMVALQGQGAFHYATDSWNPPKGALVFFASTSEYDHVGLSVGSRQVAHVEGDRKAHVRDLGYIVELPYIESYAGWAYPPEEWCEGTPIPTELDWDPRAPMPTPRAYASAVVHQNQIYVVGGCSSDVYQQFHNAVASLEVYDPALDSWAVLPSMPTPRVGPAAAVVGNKIYVIGGFTRSTWSANPVMEVYEINSGQWSTAPSKPTPCSWARAAVWHDKIYVFGGVGQGYFNVGEVFDPATNTWSSCAPFSGGRYLEAVVTVDDEIYLIGGDRWEPQHVYDDVQVYDPFTDSWTVKTPMPTAASCLDAVEVNHKIWVFGSGGLCHIYDIAADRWEEKASTQDPAGQFSVAYLNGIVYRFGGGDWGPNLDVVEAVRVSH